MDAAGRAVETAEVVPGPCLEADMGEPRAVADDDGEDVAEHGGVGLPGLRLRWAPGHGDVEDVGDVRERREGLGDGGSVREVYLYVSDGGRRRRGPRRERAAGERVDLPWPAGGVRQREDADE